MKEKILQLRKEGKSYREIEKILHCTRSLISYYVNPDGKSKNQKRQNKNRFVKRKKYKLIAGGKCQKCGYDKCMDALHFHHLNPSEKDFEISNAIWKSTITEELILNEINKCILVCANCHAEIHSNYR